MNTGQKILLAEDERKLYLVIKSELAKKGYTIDIASNGIEAETLFLKNNYSIVILDINLPFKNGIELCKIFREQNKKIPIIMLSALGEIHDKVNAFNAGADDYMVKPFYFDELFARVKVLINRADAPLQESGIIIIEDLQINLDSKKVTRGETEIALTAKEFALLRLLCANRGKVVSKQEIMHKVWDVKFDTGTNTIEVYINFLRNKIDKPYPNKLILTKAGFGYYIKEETAIK